MSIHARKLAQALLAFVPPFLLRCRRSVRFSTRSAKLSRSHLSDAWSEITRVSLCISLRSVSIDRKEWRLGHFDDHGRSPRDRQASSELFSSTFCIHRDANRGKYLTNSTRDVIDSAADASFPQKTLHLVWETEHRTGFSHALPCRPTTTVSKVKTSPDAPQIEFSLVLSRNAKEPTKGTRSPRVSPDSRA